MQWQVPCYWVTTKSWETRTKGTIWRGQRQLYCKPRYLVVWCMLIGSFQKGEGGGKSNLLVLHCSIFSCSLLLTVLPFPYPFLSLLPCPALPCPALPHPICPISSHVIQSNLILSHLVPSHLILFCPALPCLVLSCYVYVYCLLRKWHFYMCM